MGRAPALLSPRGAAFVALLAGLVAYDALAGRLAELPLRWDLALTAFVLLPTTLALVWLVLPLRTWRGLAAVAAAFGVLAAVWIAADLDVAANVAKLAAITAAGFVFLLLFEELSWVVIVAAVVPLVDAVSVWRGPTRLLVTERPEVFGALSFAFPVPGAGSFQLGLPDLLFFALFLAAADRWRLRVGWTWVAMTASFGATMGLALWLDPFGIGGLPALPLLSVAFLAANADLLWRERGGGRTTAQSAADRLQETLPALDRGTLRLFGVPLERPASGHVPVGAAARDDELTVWFEEGERLVVHSPGGVHVSRSSIRIVTAAAVTWEWFAYGAGQRDEHLRRIELRRRGDGDVEMSEAPHGTAAPDAAGPAVELRREPR